MLDLSVIVLTYNEELHIRRCLENMKDFAKEVFIIDCFSTDKTVEIAESYQNVKVLQHKWPATKYAGQFNWALENAPITAKWVLRLDADEYLSDELKRECEEKLDKLPDNITGVVLNRFHIFLEKVMDKNIPTKMLRLFQYKKGICEQRLMDEHIQLLEGESTEFDNKFYDHNLNDISWFCHKHVDYATREAADLLDIELDLTGAALTDDNKNIGKNAEGKRAKKHKYARLPLFWRSFAYFLYRFIIQGQGFQGKENVIYCFLQGWWYRTLVDAKVFEIKQKCGSDREKIIAYLLENYNIDIKSCCSKSVWGGYNVLIFNRLCGGFSYGRIAA